jgi:hypothetical protein
MSQAISLRDPNQRASAMINIIAQHTQYCIMSRGHSNTVAGSAARTEQSAIVWDVAGHAQGTYCRADADNPARPSLIYKSVLR